MTPSKPKRGRPRMDPADLKSRKFSVVTTPEIDDALTAAAATSGMRGKSEFAERLISDGLRAMDEPSQAESQIRELTYLISTLARTISSMTNRDGAPTFPWYADPFMFAALKLAISQLMDGLAPPGEIIPPPDRPEVADLFKGGIPSSMTETYRTPEARAQAAVQFVWMLRQSEHEPGKDELDRMRIHLGPEQTRQRVRRPHRVKMAFNKIRGGKK